MPRRSLERLLGALARTGLAALVREQELRTSDEAGRLGMRGSPTILINGRDPFVAAAGAAGLSCRLYHSEAGFTGAPTVEQLIEALAG